MLNIKDILNTYAPKTDTVKVEAWDKENDLIIRELSAAAMEDLQKTEGSELSMAVVAIIHGVVHEDGSRVFKHKDKKDLMKLSPADIIKVSAAIIGLTTVEVDEEEEK